MNTGAAPQKSAFDSPCTRRPLGLRATRRPLGAAVAPPLYFSDDIFAMGKDRGTGNFALIRHNS